ncbi:UNVERIFIED_CONTAM: hypothetical protein GTU68_014512 [Idotea baltica]|nr:hypothetical protein [Idotea baltica]
MAKQKTWLIGFHAVEALLQTNPELAIALSIVENTNNSTQQRIVAAVKRHNLPVLTIDKQGLGRLCGSEQHQGIALEVKPKPELKESELVGFVQSLNGTALLLILDQVQDPHNFGACLRTADAAGVDAVIVPRDNAAPLTAVVQKVASGAAATMPIYRVTNLARTMDMLKQLGIWMIGTSDKAPHSIFQQDFTTPIALVMGAEGKGLRKLTETKCDALVNLPMAGEIVSSLNVSVATGVCLYEVVRQRNAK